MLTCPLCGKPMKERVGKYGAFWGCTGYPGCRGTRDNADLLDEMFSTAEKSMEQQREEWDRNNELNLED